MEFCPLNNKNCEKEKIINIIQLKKGKIKEINVCNDCVCDYAENNLLDDIGPLKNLVETIEESPEYKLSNLKNKMAAAIEIEDYEAAAIIKKKIEDLTKKS
jgi:protein-arginine kinase activator protein McsA